MARINEPSPMTVYDPMASNLTADPLVIEALAEADAVPEALLLPDAAPVPDAPPDAALDADADPDV